MPFQAPVFNVTVNVWRPPAIPGDPPTFTYLAQLYIYSRGSTDITPTDVLTYQPRVDLRLAKGTDIEVNDVVEADENSGWFYLVRWHDRMHLGFSNEYTVAVLEQQTTGPPSATGLIIQENNDNIAMETGALVATEA